METNLTLYALTDEMAAIEAQLEESGGELTPELEERLTEINEGIVTKIDSYNTLINKTASTTDAIDAEIKRLQAIKKVRTNMVQHLKDNLCYAMQNAGLTKIEGTLCKVSLRSTEAVDIYDEGLLTRGLPEMLEQFSAQLPAWITVDYKLNKTAIKEAIKAGTDVYGAQMVSNKSIVIK